MADTSRDTFQLTSALHQVMSGSAVADARHYVRVLLQQGVPLVDADWNERDDIHRVDLQAHLKHFFGNGVPAGDLGFKIGPVTAANDFTIDAGIALVNGKLVIQQASGLTYAAQAALFDLTLPTLAPPSSGTRDDLVYLDAWEEEVGPTGERADSRLTNPVIGVETCVRVERRWVVRVAPGVSDLAAVTQEAGHEYLALARLRRIAGSGVITAARIYDLRRAGLNVSEYLKVPVDVTRGIHTVNSEGLATVLDGLRDALFDRMAGEQLFVGTVSDHQRAVVYGALQHVTQLCSTGALQARTHSLTEADALVVFTQLHAAQHAFVTTHSTNSDATADATTFRSEYEDYLDGASGIAGIEDSLDDGDVIGAHLGQQALNAWLSAPVGTLPEGSVSLAYLDVQPFEDLVAGTPYEITVEITSQVLTSDQTEEIFDIGVALSSGLWSVDRTTDVVTLTNNGGNDTLTFTVTPHSGNSLCDFEVTAVARRNPAIVNPTNVLALEIGETPAVAAVLQYAGPALNIDGRLELNEVLLSAGFAPFEFALTNRTADDHTYTVRGWMTLDSADESGWSPIVGSEFDQTNAVPAGTSNEFQMLLTAGAEVASVTGTMHMTLIRIDGVDLGVDAQESLDVDFVVVS